ncbi:hypothetical protein EJ08DRAFT_674591 [Tothia fuscella]|uniref:Uncharacterized protein n=1 Tax=Tothia fuscella TaxID=1048955 RepID=A0A9P4P238_9PEZI|nr:hypothetical protein EJ08DRAFT_674591 [Tothia fuscella]
MPAMMPGVERSSVSASVIPFTTRCVVPSFSIFTMQSLPIAILSFLAAIVAGRPSANGTWANSTAHIEARSPVVLNTTLPANFTIAARSTNFTLAERAVNATLAERAALGHIVVRRSWNATTASNSTNLLW